MPLAKVRSPNFERRLLSQMIWWEESESKKSLLMNRLRWLNLEDLKSLYLENYSLYRMVFFILLQTSVASLLLSSMSFLSQMLSISLCFSVTSLRILQNIIMLSQIYILPGWELSYCWRYLKHFRQFAQAYSNCAYQRRSLARKRQQWSMPQSLILMSLQIWMASLVFLMASSYWASSRWQMERLSSASTRQELMTLFFLISTQVLKFSSDDSQFLVQQRQFPYLKRAVEYSMIPQLFLTQLTYILKYFSQQSQSFSDFAISMKLSKAAHILLMISCCSLNFTLSAQVFTIICFSFWFQLSSTFSRMSMASSFFLASMKTLQAMMQSSRYSRCSLALQVLEKKFSSNSSLYQSEYSLQIFMEEKVSCRQQISALWNFLLLRQQRVSPRCSRRFSISVFSPIMSLRKLFLPTLVLALSTEGTTISSSAFSSDWAIII